MKRNINKPDSTRCGGACLQYIQGDEGTEMRSAPNTTSEFWPPPQGDETKQQKKPDSQSDRPSLPSSDTHMQLLAAG